MTAVEAPPRPQVVVASRRSTVTDIFAVLFATLVFAPWIVSLAMKTRLAAIVLLAAVIIYESSVLSRRAAILALIFVLPTAGLIVGLFGQSRLAGPNSYEVERLFFILPAGLRVGYLVMQNGRIRQWAQVIVCFGLVNAVLAVVEQRAGHSLFGRSVTFALMERDGGIRALLASDHSLVLGACLATCVPLVAVAGLRWKVPLSIILLWGTWATGSRGPTVIALIVTCSYALPRFAAWLRRHYQLVRSLVLGALVWLGFMGMFVWKPQAVGSTASAFSTAYRTALYADLPHIVATRPFGYGLSGLPQNVWLIDTGIFGVKDIAITLDSELLIDAALFGFIGVTLFVAALMVSVNAIGRDAYVGLAATTLTLIGLFLALSSWDSLGPLWYVLLGCAIYLRRDKRVRKRAVTQRARSVASV